MSSSRLSLFAVFVTLFALAACSSSVPRLTGFGLGNGRIVSVDEIVVLRLPLQENGGRGWRVTSYDSRYLAIAERPEFDVDANGKGDLVIKAKAKFPGETTVEVTEQHDPNWPPSRKPRVMTFDVTIVE